MDANRFNQILVVDSIPVGELNAAKRLMDDLGSYSVAYAPSPAVKYVRVETGDELIEQINSCRKDALEQDIIPMLHVECHGDEDGFQFADGSLAVNDHRNQSRCGHTSLTWNFLQSCRWAGPAFRVSVGSISL